MKTIPSPIIKQMLLTVALTLITSNAPALTYTVLKHFTGSDGYYPSGNLLLSGSTFYGTTSYGGSSDRGTVFKVNTDGSGYTVLKHFTVSDGHYPYDGLVLDGSTLYGVTRGGGSTDVGTVFKLNTDGSGYTVLKDFTGSVGKYPSGRLVLGGSTLYGVTDQGGYGSTNLGTVFKVNTDGSGYTVLKDFTGSDGKYPYGGLVLDGSTLYGVTSQGGYGSSTGTVFKVNTDGSGYTVLKDFNGSDGKYPHGGLVLDGSTLYGAASGGGPVDRGTVFKLNTDGSGYTVLKYFTGFDCYSPGGLLLSGGSLYGVAGGGQGSVFVLTTDGNSFKMLKSFTLGSGGNSPSGGLVLSGSTLYGTTSYGGSSDRGTVFALDTFDNNIPTVTIGYPPNSVKVVIYDSPLVVTGKATDNVLVTNVAVSVNDGPFINATLFSGLTDTPWSYDAGALPAATNKVVVRATDLSGNVSAPTTNTFFYSVLQTLTIVTNDVGSSTLNATASTYGTPVDGANLTIGRSYKFKVTPTAGNVYSNTVVSWTGGESNFTGTTVTFTMQSNTVITVNAPTNWFLATTGTYYGLFSSNGGVDIKSAGYFKLKVKAKASALPTFSINVQVDGEKMGGSGSFTVAGVGTLKKPIMRKNSGQEDLLVSLALDTVNQQVTGTVTTTNSLWTSELEGDQALWTLANPAADYDGQYTLVLTGDVSSVTSPGGDGYGTVTITDTNGNIKLTGNQGEGEKITQKTVLSKDGNWPLYVRGTKDTATGIYKSMVMGWVTVAPEPSRDLSGTLTQIKQASASPLYPNGFTNQVELMGSEYSVPDVNELAIALTPSGLGGVGQLTLDAEANLTPAVTVTNIYLSCMPTNKFTVPANAVTLKLKSPLYKTGIVKGDFMHGATKTSIIGVILQQENVARGYFQNGGESGSFLLEAQP